MEHKYCIRGISSCVLFLLLNIFSVNTFAQVGIGNINPSESTLLDIRDGNNNKGILIPRVSIPNLGSRNPINSAVAADESLLVYNTNPLTGKGFYFWNGVDRWVGIDGGKDWKLDGNFVTGTDFLGTINDAPLRFRTYNIEHFQITANGRFRATNPGTAGAPIYSWGADSDIGMFRQAENVLGFATDGTERFRIPNANQVHAISNGTAALPFYSWGTTNNSTTGMFSPSARALGFSTNGSERFRIPNADQVHAMSDGTQALPFYSWASDSDTGMFSPGANLLGFSTSAAERMRILSDGRIAINNTGAFNFMLNSFTAGSTGAIIGESTNGTAVQGQSLGDGDAVIGVAIGTGDGVVGQSLIGIGVSASSFNPNEMGLVSSGNNVGRVLGGPIGLGASLSGSDYGGGGFGSNLAATGMVGVGNGGLTIYSHPEGSGVAGTGNKVGVYGYAVNGETGDSNNGNSGGYFALGTNAIPNSQVRAYAKIAGYHKGSVPVTPGGSQGNNNTNSYYGGFFAGGVDNWRANPAYAYVGIKYNTNNSGESSNSSTNYKIIGNGTVSTLVDDSEGNKRILFAPEAPEILFEDYGLGQLKNGSIYIEIDPLFTKSIFVSEKHPLKVFIQLEGECNGVYVTEKSANGFYVKELNGGASNTPFSYHLVANRADEIARDGSVESKHVGLRFPIGPGLLEMAKMKTVEVKEAKSKTVIEKKNIDTVVNSQSGIQTIEENTSPSIGIQETPVKSTETEKNRFQTGN